MSAPPPPPRPAKSTYQDTGYFSRPFAIALAIAVLIYVALVIIRIMV